MSLISASGFDPTSVGSIFQGLSVLLATVGSGIGFTVKQRRDARRDRLRAETAAAVAAQETRKALEERVEEQQKELIQTYKEQIVELQRQHRLQIEQLKAQLRSVELINEHLMSKIMEAYKQ